MTILAGEEVTVVLFLQVPPRDATGLALEVLTAIEESGVQREIVPPR